MYELKVTSSFSSAHSLRGYNGKCEDIHGHNWNIEVIISGEKLNKTGLLIDFKILKKYLGEIIDTLDHKFINDIDFFKKTNPSAENIARYIYERFEKSISNEYSRDISINRVNVYETPSSMASFYKNPQ